MNILWLYHVFTFELTCILSLVVITLCVHSPDNLSVILEGIRGRQFLSLHDSRDCYRLHANTDIIHQHVRLYTLTISLVRLYKLTVMQARPRSLHRKSFLINARIRDRMVM
ncbi:hypothetical protein C8Q78DRAFT_1022800 [Trametes maxima]|nr:hypothetical protein C8Q78DRAFT_1022800 [Trametes maxima]